MQSRKQSIIETCTNTGVGFVGSLLITWICISYINNPGAAAITSTVACTVWSLVRGYTLRRHFNKVEFLKETLS